MLQWATEHRGEFYLSIYPKLLATEHESSVTGITVIVQRSVSSKDTEQSSTGHEGLPAMGGDCPDSRGQGMGPDVGTLTHQDAGGPPRIHDSE